MPRLTFLYLELLGGVPVKKHTLYQQDLKWTQPDSDNHGSQKKQRHCRSVHVLRLIQDSELFTLYAPLRGVAFQPSNERAVYFQEKNRSDLFAAFDSASPVRMSLQFVGVDSIVLYGDVLGAVFSCFGGQRIERIK